MGPAQKAWPEKEKNDRLRPKLWRGKGRNSDVMAFVQDPFW